MKLHRWPSAIRTTALVLVLPVIATAIGAAQQREPRSSEVEARRATALDQFLSGDEHGALDTLNEIGEPRISDVKLEGLARTRPALVRDYLGIGAGDLLTSERLTRTGRRLAELPFSASTSARYDLLSDSVVLRPVLVERDLFPADPMDYAPIGARAIFTRELRVNISNLTGNGDVWTPSFRWAAGRPRLALGVAAPAPGLIPGIAHLSASWEKQHFPPSAQTPTAANAFEVDRTRIGGALSDWATHWLRWEGGVAYNRISDTSYLELGGELNARAFGDRLAAIAASSWFDTATPGDGFATGEFVVAMRTTTRDDEPMITGRAGYAVAGQGAPVILWPTAASGSDQAGMLRAHRFYNSGVLSTETFGGQLLFGTAEYVHPLPTRLGPAFLGLAGFVDAAQAWSRLQPTDSPIVVDVGVGLRANTSRHGSQVRLDFGYGLRDGRTRVTAAYVQPWGIR